MRAPTWKLWTALWIVYLVWGSTYLAIRVSVRTLPPFLSGGLRFVVAGALLAAWLAWRGRSLRVSLRELAAAALVGAALLTFGVGVVTYAETDIASSLAAILASSVPLQVVVLRGLFGKRPPALTLASVAVGLAGIGLVVVPGGGGESTATGLALMVGATVSWSLGSFFAGRLPLPGDRFVAAVYEMLSGGVLLLLLGLATGEAGDVDPSAFSAESIVALAYLGLVGSLVGFTAYMWLLGHAPISKVVTHQYVNPLVAIVLGAVFLGENLAVTTLAGAALVVGSVFAVVRREEEPRSEPQPAAEPDEVRQAA
jgi:drug/metabolite transporter (DMT)-like permease